MFGYENKIIVKVNNEVVTNYDLKNKKIVPIGKVGFVIYDDRKSSQTVGEYFALDISKAPLFG